MTAIFSLAPVNDTNATLTTINTNVDGLEAAVGTPADPASATGTIAARLGAIAAFIDGLEAAVGTPADPASATGTIAARLGAIAGFLDQLEGFTDGIEGVLGLASATPGANTINANLVRNVKASAQCSSSANTQGSVAVNASGGTASTLATAAAAGIDWRRISIHNNGSVPVLLAIGATATASLYSFPLPAGVLLVLETLTNVTALSSTGNATTCLVTVEV